MHTKRVDELRKMVVQIASDIGIDATDLLQDEVDALGKRLENVRESITTLADIADARAENEQDCNRNITEAKSYLNDVQQVQLINYIYTVTYRITIEWCMDTFVFIVGNRLTGFTNFWIFQKQIF